MHFDEPTAQHRALRERPGDVARIYIYKDEWPDLRTLCAEHGPCEVIGYKAATIIPAGCVEVLCMDSTTAYALVRAWYHYCQTSPHRPDGMKKSLLWGARLHADSFFPSK